MKIPQPSPLALFFTTLLFHFFLVHAETRNTNTTDFSCLPNTSTPCNTFVLYRPMSPEFLNLSKVSNLFGVSRLSIAESSSDKVGLTPGQSLLVPVLCSCTGKSSYANISYQIKEGDSFYQVSVRYFGRLTDFHAVEALNPSLSPTNLTVGQEVVFPLYCKCPARDQLEQGINLLITYVWQAEDSILQVSNMMNSSPEAIVAVNENRSFTAAVDLPVLIPVSNRPPLFQPPCTPPLTRKKFTNIVTVGSVLGAAMFLVLCSLLVLAYRHNLKTKEMSRMRSDMETLFPLKKSCRDQSSSKNTIQDNLLVEVSVCLGKPIIFTTEVVLGATMNLNERYRIDGSVYQAIINGEIFAVKQFRGDATGEMRILLKVNHANLVKLMGISADAGGNLLLVYEYAENRSLDKWLYPQSSPLLSTTSFLSWRQRLRIALDVAHGLQYMHEHTRPSIVHGDIRASNILLGSRFKAKISNFSTAKPATMAVTPKIDVFVFGVLLLELISGKKAMQTRKNGELGMLWKEIRLILEVEEEREERVKQWMDPKLETLNPMEGALGLAAMARACTSEKPSERPSMGENVFSLSILAESCMEVSQRSWTSNMEENLQIISPVVAR